MSDTPSKPIINVTAQPAAEIDPAQVAAVAVQNYMDQRTESPTAMVVPSIIVPLGYAVHSLESVLEHPTRIKADHTVTTVDSFARYVQRFATPGSVIYVHHTKPLHCVCVLDGHNGPDNPRWGSHVVRLQVPVSDEWKAWQDSVGQWHSQERAVEILEELRSDVVAPAAADVLELLMDLRVQRNAQIHQLIQSRTGSSKVCFTEDIEVKGGAKDVELPEHLTLKIPLIRDGDAVEVKLRWRVRADQKKLTMQWQFVREFYIWKWVQAQLREQVARLTGIPQFDVAG